MKRHCSVTALTDVDIQELPRARLLEALELFPTESSRFVKLSAMCKKVQLQDIAKALTLTTMCKKMDQLTTLEHLAAEADAQLFVKGQVVVSEGQHSDFMHGIIAGELEAVNKQGKVLETHEKD